MKCDGAPGCTIEPMRAIRLVIPHTFRIGFDLLKPRRVMTPFHYCELHKMAANEDRIIAALLTPTVKADVERVAKAKWPDGYLPDFEKTSIDWVLVTTPEYRAFMAALGYHGVMGAAQLAPEQQRALQQKLGVVRIADGT